MPHIEQTQLQAMQAQATALYQANPSFDAHQRGVFDSLLGQVVVDANVFYNGKPQYFDPAMIVSDADIGTINTVINGVHARNRRTALTNFLKARNTASRRLLASPQFDRDFNEAITYAQQHAFYRTGHLQAGQPDATKLFQVANLAAMRYLKQLKQDAETQINPLLAASLDPLTRARELSRNIDTDPNGMTQKHWFLKQYLEKRIRELPAEIATAQRAAQAQFDALTGNGTAYDNGDDAHKQGVLTGVQAAPIAGDLQQNHFQALVAAELVQVNARIADKAAAQTQFEGFVGNPAAYAALTDDARFDALAAAQAAPVVGNPQNNHFRTLITAALGPVNQAIDAAAQAQFLALTGPGTAYANGDDNVKHNALIGVGPVAGETDRRYRILVAAELVQVNARLAVPPTALAQFHDLGGLPGGNHYANLVNEDDKFAVLTAAQAAPIPRDLLQNNLQALITNALVAVNLAIDTAAQRLFFNLTNSVAYQNMDDVQRQNTLTNVPVGVGETDSKYRALVAGRLVQVNARIAARRAAQVQLDDLGGAPGAGAYAGLVDNVKHVVLTAAQAATIHGDVQQNHFQGLVGRELVQVNARIAARAAGQIQFNTLTVNDPAYVAGDDAHKRGVLAAAQAAPIHGDVQQNHFQGLVAAELLKVDAVIAAKTGALMQFEFTVGDAAVYATRNDNQKYDALMSAQAAVPNANLIRESHFRGLITAALGPVDLAIDVAAQAQFDALGGGYAVLPDDQAKRAILAGVPAGAANETERRFKGLVAAELARLAPAAMTFSNQTSASEVRTQMAANPAAAEQIRQASNKKRM